MEDDSICGRLWRSFSVPCKRLSLCKRKRPIVQWFDDGLSWQPSNRVNRVVVPKDDIDERL